MSAGFGVLSAVLLAGAVSVITWLLTRQGAERRLRHIAGLLEANSPLTGTVRPVERRLLEVHARLVVQLQEAENSPAHQPTSPPLNSLQDRGVRRAEVLLGQFSDTISTCFILPEVYDIIPHFAPLVFPFGGQYSFHVPDTDVLRLQLNWPDPADPEPADQQTWPLASCAAALHHRTLPFTQGACRHPGPSGATCLPVTAGGQLFVVLSLNPENDVTFASRFTDRLDLTFDRLTLLERLVFESDHDALTGLPNRRKLLKVLEHADEDTGALLLDIDLFKQVNETYGHAVGDEVLKGVAACLASGIRGTDLAGHLGGEEFLVVLMLVDEGVLRRKTEELRQLISSQAFRTSAGPIALTVSIGAALKGDGRFGAVERADTALYQAKAAGRNQVYWSGNLPDADD
jgi:diguanylate cyclase (GGDEF)-like protein